jgi:hypothetical protein
MRWLWLKKTQLDRPWEGLHIQVHPNAAALFVASVQTTIGDGATTLFWSDRWLDGRSLPELAHSLAAVVCLNESLIQE